MNARSNVGTLDREVMSTLCFGGTTPMELHSAAVAIRLYGDDAIKLLLKRRAEQRAHVEATQRKWQHKVSRRAQRGNHHDSWSIRESYVRGRVTGNYEIGHAKIITAFVLNGATRIQPNVMGWLCDTHGGKR